MVFSSHIFIFYFLPIALLLYWVAPSKLRNVILLAVSLMFYTWGAPKFILLLVLSSVVDFLVAKQMNPNSKRLMLSIGVAFNVALLLYFKYANFFVENIQLMTGDFEWVNVILPIGISFVTFQKISYLVDVYQGTTKAQERLHDYMLFVVLFPQLIAGPIVRYKDVDEQLTNRSANYNLNTFFDGVFVFVIGLAKKVLLANVLGAYVDKTFTLDITSLSTEAAWLAMIAYSFQIYFDFSGYSDMAIGLGRMFGFIFPENFNWPYLSSSITEFWKRWHMSLGAFFKDYLYIPLGGNRVGVKKGYLNLTIVFLISGFWHGASWNFVLWGMFHGVFLVLDRLFLAQLLDRAPRMIAVLLTYFLVICGWVMFRFETVEEFTEVFSVMFSFKAGEFVPLTNRVVFTVLAVSSVSLLSLYKPIEQFISRGYFGAEKPSTIVFKGLTILVLFILSVGELTLSGFNPFIYFRF